MKGIFKANKFESPSLTVHQIDTNNSDLGFTSAVWLMSSQLASTDGNLFPVSFYKVQRCFVVKTIVPDLFKRLFDIFSIL